MLALTRRCFLDGFRCHSLCKCGRSTGIEFHRFDPWIPGDITLIVASPAPCMARRSRWMTAVGMCCILSILGCDRAPVPERESNTPVSSGVPVEPVAPTANFQSQRPASTAPARECRVRLTDIAPDVGIDFIYDNGARGQLLMVESIGGGVAWLDFDLDSRLDLYLTQGGDAAAPEPGTRPADRLYRQLSVDLFVAVEQPAGIDERHYGQGVAVGDFDNDGFPDIYVTNVGANSFYRNLGDGTFEEIAGPLGLDDARWSSSAAWADLDLDGDLDLYVCNYLKYDPYQPFKCEKDGLPALCHPRQLPHWPDECFENLGDGRFAPRSQEWNLQGDGNKALGVAIADFTNSGRPDIYVANDTTPNFLFVKQDGPGYRDEALKLGTALSGDGAMQASMGIAVGDFDRNGALDLYLTHFTGESNTLYQNHGEFGFQDISGLTGIRRATYPKLGFGTVMADLDADGRMELFVTNGHIDERNADGDGYQQQPQLLSYDGKSWFDCSAAAGPFFSGTYVGRGVATGDFDQDGDDDLFVVHQNAPSALLRNDSPQGNWLRLRFIGRQSNRFGIGVRVTATGPGIDPPLVTELAGGTSFCATHEPSLFLPLAAASGPVTLKIRWPGGPEQTLEVEQINRVMTLIEP